MALRLFYDVILQYFSTKMDFNSPPQPQQHDLTSKTQKFKKNSSLSSIKTNTDFYLEDETTGRKITLEQKQTFVELITQKNFNMKEAAKRAKISYSTAKKVFAKFRRNLKGRNITESAPARTGPQCSFICINAENPVTSGMGVISLISTIGGREQKLVPFCNPCPSE